MFLSLCGTVLEIGGNDDNDENRVTFTLEPCVKPALPVCVFPLNGLPSYFSFFSPFSLASPSYSPGPSATCLCIPPSPACLSPSYPLVLNTIIALSVI